MPVPRPVDVTAVLTLLGAGVARQSYRLAVLRLTGLVHTALRLSSRSDSARLLDVTLPCVCGKMVCVADKPDVRLVVHYGLTQSLEAYYQQTGKSKTMPVWTVHTVTPWFCLTSIALHCGSQHQSQLHSARLH